jgi:hypothetical protein
MLVGERNDLHHVAWAEFVGIVPTCLSTVGLVTNNRSALSAFDSPCATRSSSCVRVA